MNKAQLPVLTSIMMISQAVLSTPCGLRAKRSLKARNGMLLAGFGAMSAADLTFAKLSSPPGDLTMHVNYAKPLIPNSSKSFQLTSTITASAFAAPLSASKAIVVAAAITA